MAYAFAISRVLADQLNKFATLNRYQLVGHVATLEFWVAEARHCLDVIDNYRPVFDQVKAAQKQYVAERDTIRFDVDDPASLQGTAAPLQRVPEAELKEARSALCDGMYYFLVRCLHEGILDESDLRKACGSLGIRVESADLKRR